jgi:bacterial/archaeal transporter family-2 protein
VKSIFFAFAVFLGVVLALHLAMNGKVGASINNARVGNAFFWCVGAAMAVIIGISGWQPGALSGLRHVNPLLLTAGALGASLVFAIAWLLPQVGARGMFLSMLTGQIIGSMMISHFGWLGSPVQRLTPISIFGAITMFGGALLTTYTK